MATIPQGQGVKHRVTNARSAKAHTPAPPLQTAYAKRCAYLTSVGMWPEQAKEGFVPRPLRERELLLSHW